MSRKMTELEQVVLAIRLGSTTDNGVKEVNIVDSIQLTADYLKSIDDGLRVLGGTLAEIVSSIDAVSLSIDNHR